MSKVEKQNKWKDPFYKDKHIEEITVKFKSGKMPRTERRNLIKKGAFRWKQK